MRTARRHADPSILITEAPISLDDQQASRRRKYALMMSSRVVCLLLAAAVFRVSIVLALLLIAGGMILPWCAVLIANDRPAKKSERVARFRGGKAGARQIAPLERQSHPDADHPDSAPPAAGADMPAPREPHRVIEG